MIPYGRQSVTEDDLAEVVKVLQSDWLTQGPTVDEFESAFAEMCGADHAIAVCNGTAALHLAMLAAGVNEGDRVVTTPNTFVASANSAAYVGARVDFVDIDPVSYCLSPDQFAIHCREKGNPKAVVVVDFAGHPAEVPRISEIARSEGTVVIEDACHAVGGRFGVNGRGFRVGGHPWADLTTFSFHPVKTMTTGEGGMVVTNNREYADRIRILRSHGIVRSKEEFRGELAQYDEVQPWYYEMQELGFNYRLSDIHAALGVSQLKRLNDFIGKRQEIVDRYNQAFENLPLVKIPRIANWIDPGTKGVTRLSWHLYVLLIDFSQLGKSRTVVMTELKELGVGTQVHYIPVNSQVWYREKFPSVRETMPNMANFYESCLSIPLYPTMAAEDVEQVIDAVKRVCQ